MTAHWQPLNHSNDLFNHALFIVEVKPKAFTHLAPFYGIVRLSEGSRITGDVSFDTPLFNADGDESGYTVADISRLMPFDPKEYE